MMPSLGLRKEARAMRGAAAGGLAALMVVAVAAATARRAEACGAPDPSMRAWLPAPDQANVPTNTRIWVRGIVGQVRLSAGEGASEDLVDTDLTRSQELPPTVEAILRRPLKPNTTYKVTVAAPQVVPLFFSITTGAGPALAVPAAPPALALDTREVHDLPGSCGIEGFSIRVTSPPVDGAALYLLERFDEATQQFERLAVRQEPSFQTAWSRLPSPTYRIRPLSQAGLSPDDGALPTAAAVKSDGKLYPDEEADEGVGGCAATTEAVSSSWLLALLLAQRLSAPAAAAPSNRSRGRRGHRGPRRW